MARMALLFMTTFGLIVGGASLFAVSPPAASQDNPPAMMYGAELMTPEERMQMRERMRNAKSAEERRQIQAEHHARMQERAKERGITLPEKPMREPGSMRGGGGMGRMQGGGGGRQ